MAGLAAVAAWWNPSGSEERWRAHQTFKKRWPADIPLHVSPAFGTAPVWQKERLLNRKIASLPTNIDKVVWADADILIDSPTWAADVATALDKWPVIQPWSFAGFHDAHGNPGTGPFGLLSVQSVPAANDDATESGHDPSGLPVNAWPGFAWAARREVLEEIGGLYEADLSGPNDVLMSLAFYGDFENTFLMRYGGRFRDHYLPWAERAYRVVRGQVGYVPAVLTHLWHGPFDGRRYLERTVRLYEAGYDPDQHLVTAPDGTLALTDDCPWEVRRRAAECVGVTLEPPR